MTETFILAGFFLLIAILLRPIDQMLKKETCKLLGHIFDGDKCINCGRTKQDLLEEVERLR